MFHRLNDATLRAEANNFTLVRLILSSSVIYTHCYWLTTGRAGGDEFSAFLGSPISVFAVDGFFFLSGFLVYPSLVRFGRSTPFLLARLARLWPALAASVVLTVVGGAFVTSAGGLDYLAGDTAQFMLGNLTFAKGEFNLTGVSCEARPCTVNGSLWTLPWEARCYVALALLGVLGLARPAAMKWFVLPATLIGAFVWHLPGVQAFAGSWLGEGVVYQLHMLDRLWALFALGTAAYLFRDRLRLSWAILAALFGVLLLSNGHPLELHARALFIGYAVLCFGLLTAEKGALSGRWPDYSYGIYIYAFPIMMAAHAVMPGVSHWTLAAANFLLTLPVAVLSWHFLEKPVMEAVKRQRQATRPGALTAQA